MPLHLVKREDLADSYIVRSGNMRAGVITRVEGAGGAAPTLVATESPVAVAAVA